jgi:glycosyltransferase involved in cell wall biosynthesis
MIEALLKTGRYQFICLGGAIQHQDYTPQKVEPYGEDWIIYPIDGYGTQEMIRSIMHKERPDLLWFMTDPRFYGWLWEIENEVRANIPMVYYHVWDNFPAPSFNRSFYQSNDEVVCISKVTYEILKDVAPDTNSRYLPHAVNNEIFKKFKNNAADKEKMKNLAEQIPGLDDYYSTPQKSRKKIFFWNNRNARRKQSGTVLWWFKEFLDDVGHDKAMLIMHTDARDQHGQDLPHLIEHHGLKDGQIILSTQKISAEDLAVMYNLADFTINIADAEGFGLATLESLSCGTPIIVNMTGGLQEQVTNGKEWFGWGIQPSSKAVIGSLQVPYIYEDRVNKDDFIGILKKAIKVSAKAYKNMSDGGLRHVKENYNFENYEKRWVETIDEIIDREGSWSTRKNYKRWHLMEVA